MSSKKQKKSGVDYKLVVLGAAGVGKSALCVQYNQKYFVEDYDPTIEDTYRKVIQIDNRMVRLEILDTAGTSQFQAMRNVYFRTGNGFLLVYDVTRSSSLEECREIHDTILAVKDLDKVPCVLAGNKTDLKDARVVIKDTGEATAKELNATYFEMSAKEYLNVDESFETLVRLIFETEPEVPDNPERTRCLVL